MAKQRMINTRFWVDDYTANLDPTEKLLFLYFLTNPYTDICGVYEVPLKHIALETGIDKEMVEKIIKRFSKDGKIFYENGWVAIRNFAKHQLDNPKVKKGIEIGLSKAPKYIIDRLSIDYEPLSHLNSNLNSNSNTNVATKVAYTEEDIEISKLLLKRIQDNTPTFKEPNIEKWANECRLMREIDNRTNKQIRFLVEWSQKDTFWQANILSMKKLRQKFDTLVSQIKRSATATNQKEILI